MIELEIPYEKKALGQLLAELKKKKKWRKCIVSVETTLPGRQTEKVSFSKLRIISFVEYSRRFELELEPTKDGFLPANMKWFFWPGEQDEADKDGLKKLILSITVLEAPGLWPAIKNWLKHYFGIGG